MVLPLPSSTIGTGPRIVTAHGFTQTRDLWGHFGSGLATTYSLTNCDLPGHGTASDDVCNLEEAGIRLAAAASGEPFVLLGYSLGGRTALLSALGRPAGLAGLVLISAHPGLEDHDARDARREADEALAGQLRSEGDVEAFIDEWLAGPLFAGLPPDPVARAIRCTNTAEGLASSLETMGLGTQRPCFDELSTLDIPVLLVTGDRDLKFTALAHDMVARLSHGHHVTIANAGHSCHLEDPMAALAAVSAFVETIL